MESPSVIILKEKERQEKLLKEIDFFQEPPAVHKNTLENLKEYMEDQLKKIEKLMELLGNPLLSDDEMLWSIKNMVLLGMKNQLKMDIIELTKMIGRYE